MQSNHSGLRDVSGPRAALAGQPQATDSTPTRPADEPQTQQQHTSTRSRGASNYGTQDDKNITITRHSGERRGATSSRYSTQQQLDTIKDYKNIKRNVGRTGRPHRSWTAVSNNGERQRTSRTSSPRKTRDLSSTPQQVAVALLSTARRARRKAPPRRRIDSIHTNGAGFDATPSRSTRSTIGTPGNGHRCTTTAYGEVQEA